jgi:nitroreductase
MSHQERLSMPLGEAMYTQRAIRRFRPDPLAVADLELILEAASKAPNGGNSQRARFLVVTDRALIREFGALYREAWWAKRRDQDGISGPEEMTPEERERHAAPMRLADEMKDVPCVVFALSLPPNYAESVFPACQNLMLAARALGIGSVPTRLHPVVMDKVRRIFDIPPEVVLHFAIPLGYPRGRFGPTKRLPTWQTSYLDRWLRPVPWAPEEAS